MLSGNHMVQTDSTHAYTAVFIFLFVYSCSYISHEGDRIYFKDVNAHVKVLFVYIVFITSTTNTTGVEINMFMPNQCFKLYFHLQINLLLLLLFLNTMTIYLCS